MREESDQGITLPNEPELTYRYIKSELEDKGIDVQRISIDDTIITNKEVPKELQSRIREFVADKGITLKFEVSGQEN